MNVGDAPAAQALALAWGAVKDLYKFNHVAILPDRERASPRTAPARGLP